MIPSNATQGPPVTVQVTEAPLLSPEDAARILRVSSRTVIRWADAGRIPLHSRTAGGHRRFERSEVEKVRDQLARAR